MLAVRKEPSDDQTGCQKLSESLYLEVKGERQAADEVIIPLCTWKSNANGQAMTENVDF